MYINVAMTISAVSCCIFMTSHRFVSVITITLFPQEKLKTILPRWVSRPSRPRKMMLIGMEVWYTEGSCEVLM